MMTTVGAALRGRPFFETHLLGKTGGHGEPPLQLLRVNQIQLHKQKRDAANTILR